MQLLKMTKFGLAILNTQPPHLYFGGVERRILEVTKRIQKDADVTIYCGTKAGFSTPINIDEISIVRVNQPTDFFHLTTGHIIEASSRTKKYMMQTFLRYTTTAHMVYRIYLKK